MECFEARAALKSGVRFLESTSTEPADSQYSSLVDGFWAAGGGDEQFSVEEYFNLSAVEEGIKEGGFTFGEDGELEEEEEEEEKVSLSSSSSASLSSMSSQDQLFDEGSSFSDAALGSFLFGSGELAIVPVDDMKELEIWSKHLMDDNTLPHEFTAAYPTTTGPYSLTHDPRPSTTTPTRPPTEPIPKPPVQLQPTTIPLLPPKHPRSKLVRKPGVAWHFSQHLKPESLSSSSSSSSSSATSSSSEPGFVFVPNPLQQPAVTAEESNHHHLSTKPAKKKQKRNRASSETSATGPVQARRCSHCQVQKTPQWRTGPLGPRTLCNACGVRFKSGRLFPEYRPACSPTFSSEVHSNSHRKVLEMRMKRKRWTRTISIGQF